MMLFLEVIALYFLRMARGLANLYVVLEYISMAD
jgi:hypothetical protein